MVPRIDALGGALRTGCTSRFLRRLVCAGLASLALAGAAQAEVKGPLPTDRQVTISVLQLLRRAHLTRHPLDNEISKRWMASYLKALDPLKMYFLQADVDQFLQDETNLDNFATRGDTAFAYKVYKVFLQRVKECASLAEKFAAQPVDFTVDETMHVDPKTAKYAQTPAEQAELWRKRVKYDMLNLRADGMADDKVREKLGRRYRSIAKRMEQTTPDELLEMYLTAMTSSYDPHTTYMSIESVENFRILMSLQLDGIGATLRSEDGQTIISEVVPGGAAGRDGRLKAEDRVVGVGEGESGEIVDVAEMKLSDVVRRIRGKAGTVVRLEVIPAASAERKVYNIVRAKIELKGSEARGEVIEAGKKADGTPYKIGVINLPSFYLDMEGARLRKPNFKSTTKDVEKLLNDPETGFKAKGVDVVIMDLRNNGGGSLSEAISLTGLFIDQGPVVQVKDWEGQIKPHDDTDPKLDWGGPLVVLTSRLSASAAEIFAGAIQDYNRGLVIGDVTTHGKGTVQSLLELGEFVDEQNPPNLGSIKLTMQQFYRPNGHSTQREGVRSDVVVPSLLSVLDIGEGNLDFAVPFDKIPAAQFKSTGQVTDSVRKELQLRSTQRVQSEKEFQKVTRDIEKYLKRKDRKEVSLNEEKFKADRADLESEKKLDEKEEIHQYDKPVVDRNFYFEEVLRITLDYLKLAHVAARN